MAALRSRAENLVSELAMQQSRADELERVQARSWAPLPATIWLTKRHSACCVLSAAAPPPGGCPDTSSFFKKGYLGIHKPRSDDAIGGR
jgi:hypothetical protein